MKSKSCNGRHEWKLVTSWNILNTENRPITGFEYECRECGLVERDMVVRETAEEIEAKRQAKIKTWVENLTERERERFDTLVRKAGLRSSERVLTDAGEDVSHLYAESAAS